MATLIDALAVTLNWNARAFSHEAESAWQSFARAAREPGSAFRSIQAAAKGVAELMGRFCSDAFALRDSAAERLGLGVQGDEPIETGRAAALTPGGLAVGSPLSIEQPARLADALMPAGEVATRHEEGAVTVAPGSGVAAYPHRRDGAWVAHPVRDGAAAVPPGPQGATIATQPEALWQDALLALGSLKILSSTNALPGLAPALEIASAFGAQGGGGGPVSRGASFPVHGRAAAAIALRALRNDAQSVGALAYPRGQTSRRAAGAVGSGISEPISHGEKDIAQDAGEWTAIREADFKQAFGVDVLQSTPEQRLIFVDWESRDTEQPAGDVQAGGDAQDGGATSRPIEVVLSRLLGVEPAADDMRETRQRGVAAAPLYEAPFGDVREQGGAAAVVTAMAAQAGTSQTANAITPARSTSETHIHGAITLVTQAADGPAIARDLAGLGHSQRLIQQGNTGIF